MNFTKLTKEEQLTILANVAEDKGIVDRDPSPSQSPQHDPPDQYFVVPPVVIPPGDVPLGSR